ncbi:7tm 6 domain containing protein, partial [Asbolus verrucosus]
MNIFTLKALGLWPKNDELYKFNLYSLYTAVSIIIINGAIFFQVMYIVHVHLNLEDLIDSIFITIAQILASIKMCLFMRNVRILKQLMVTLKSDYFKVRTIRQRELIQPALSIWKTTYVTFWILVNTTIVLWAILPLFNKEKDLPFKALFPYDTTASPIYEITYLHQVIGIFLCAMASLNIDIFMAALMMIVGAQCDLLCDD